MVEQFDYDRYNKLLIENGWDSLAENVADHLKRKGFSLSDSLFVRAELKTLLESEDGPLAGRDPLLGDAYEMIIIGRVIDRLIDSL